jgi:hypothetical protein
MLDEMLKHAAVQRIAVRYVIDKVAPFADNALTADDEAMHEFKVGPALAEMRSILDRPEIPAALAGRLVFLADRAGAYAVSLGIRLDRPDSIRGYVYLFVPLEEQAEFTLWEIRRVAEEHMYSPVQELGRLETIGKRLTMNLNVYMEIKAMALSGADVGQDELHAFEQAIVHQIQQARPVVRSFSV